MTLIRIPEPWQMSERTITPEAAFFSRRRFLKTLVGVGIAGSALPLLGCQKPPSDENPIIGVKALKATPNSAFTDAGRAVTNENLAATYNNFYEYGGTKSIWTKAQALPTDDWKVEVTGLVNNPRAYDLDDLMTKFPLEERIYRFRCVEA